MATPKVSDESTTRAMVAQYEATVQTFQTAQGHIDSLKSVLNSQWRSDASKVMDGGLAGWLAGFERLKSNVYQMGDAVHSYNTGNQEVVASTSGSAGGWAQAAPAGSAS